MTLHPLYPAITAQNVLAECTRELAQRRNFYPTRIAEGRMTQGEADHQIALAAAWQQDTQRVFARWFGDTRELAAATHGMSWSDRRDGLRRELALRARVYPARIADGRMTQAQADHRRDCLAAFAAVYDDGLDWTASNGESRIYTQWPMPPEVEQAYREWLAHRAAVEAARQPQPQQKELL